MQVNFIYSYSILLNIIKTTFTFLSCLCATDLYAFEKTQTLTLDSSSSEFSDPIQSTNTNSLVNIFNYRLNLSKSFDNIKLESHYQISSTHNNQRNLTYTNPDDKKLFNLSSLISESDKEISQHGLDRFSVSYNTLNTSVKFGRQAISWGNGLVFNVMDIFNPFSPTAIDKEYKPGDDMLYFQFLSNNGDDWQGLYLPRRNDDLHIDNTESSFAVKYHTVFSDLDFNLLLANHFDDEIVGIGLNRSIGDALWRLDITNTNIQGKNILSLITNIDYSWTSFNNNVYGFLEIYHNGFGNEDSVDLNNIPLNNRLIRGEIFSLFKNYIAGGISIELHPLLKFTPTYIYETSKNTNTLFLSINYDWAQNFNISSSLIYQDTNELFPSNNSVNILFRFYF